jgi:hypothetical protein
MSQLNFANQNLRDRCFKRQYLRGADFRGSDIRGCDFSGATLIGANFERAKAGISYRQQITLIILAIAFSVATVDAIAFALSGSYEIAVAISLAMSLVAAFMTPSVISFIMLILITVGVTGAGNWIFSVAIAIGFTFAVVVTSDVWLATTFTLAAAFGLVVAVVCGFAGNLGTALAFPSVFTVALIFAGFVTFVIVCEYGYYLREGAGKFAIAASVTSNFAVITILSGAIATHAISDQTYLTAATYAVISIVGAIAATYALLRAIHVLRNTSGTSFRGADLTDASFNRAILKNTDFLGAKSSRASHIYKDF